jgi:hypothetical protein
MRHAARGPAIDPQQRFGMLCNKYMPQQRFGILCKGWARHARNMRPHATQAGTGSDVMDVHLLPLALYYLREQQGAATAARWWPHGVGGDTAQGSPEAQRGTNWALWLLTVG